VNAEGSVARGGLVEFLSCATAAFEDGFDVEKDAQYGLAWSGRRLENAAFVSFPFERRTA
jgi:hypothetical protein